MKKMILFFALTYFISTTVYTQAPQKYSAQEIRCDLKYMYETLEKSNYNLFAYIKKEKMDSIYNEIYYSINDSLTALETFRLFKPFVSLAKMSHCSIYNSWSEYYGGDAKQEVSLFPLDLYFSEGKAFVNTNFSVNTSINRSDEIISFNDQPMNEFMADFFKYITGPSDYYKNSSIEQTRFSRLYWFFYGDCDKFKLGIRKRNGQVENLIIHPIPRSEFEEKIKEQKSNMRYHKEYRMIDNNTAFLHPGVFLNVSDDFDMSDPRTYDNTKFCQFIDSSFTYFQHKGTKNLIIDLRNNPGGDNSFSDYMIAYLASKPFSIASKFRIKTSQMTKDFWKEIDIPEVQAIKEQILSLENGTSFDIDIPIVEPHDDSKRFKGNVYVLINRYSYSNAAMVSAIIQDYNFGVIIGEETTEEVTSFGAMHTFKLLNTKLTVAYPKSFFVRPNGDITPRGVVPDYLVDIDIFSDKDKVLERTLKIIADKEKTSR